MGYTTKFTGELLFTNELKASELFFIQQFFGEDVRDHSDWNVGGAYIDLRLNKEMTGIEWDDETEKNYGMVDHINFIIDQANASIKDFGLSGVMIAQGEDPSDRWKIVMVNGKAVRDEIIAEGRKVKCPHCKKSFVLE